MVELKTIRSVYSVIVNRVWFIDDFDVTLLDMDYCNTSSQHPPRKMLMIDCKMY